MKVHNNVKNEHCFRSIGEGHAFVHEGNLYLKVKDFILSDFTYNSVHIGDGFFTYFTQTCKIIPVHELTVS